MKRVRAMNKKSLSVAKEEEDKTKKGPEHSGGERRFAPEGESFV